eukprot:15142556-Alexandrium_andersonii.AAC.1
MVDLIRDLKAQATEPDRAQHPRTQDEPVPIARTGSEHLEVDQRHDRLQLARTARAVRHRGR